MRRTVYGIGETICDIIFKDNHPQAASPGGSTFNAMVSLGRMRVDTSFISKIGDDKVGQLIMDFMHKNHVSTDNMTIWEGHKTDISLAFINEKGDADYSFYKEYDKQFVEAAIPDFRKNDILLFGSYFALNPLLRPLVEKVVRAAKAADVIIYYDPNFRSSHLHELEAVMPALKQNMTDSTIVRGSDEDFKNIFDVDTHEQVEKCVSSFISQFIITKNSDKIEVNDKGARYDFPAKEIVPLSTIGAGDNFNAGFIYALLKYNITFDDLNALEKDVWEKLIAQAVAFATDVCQSYENYISVEFAKNEGLR